MHCLEGLSLQLTRSLGIDTEGQIGWCCLVAICHDVLFVSVEPV